MEKRKKKATKEIKGEKKFKKENEFLSPHDYYYYY